MVFLWKMRGKGKGVDPLKSAWTGVHEPHLASLAETHGAECLSVLIMDAIGSEEFQSESLHSEKLL